jgi:5-methylcytosine-specific restriction enzyme B
LSDKTNGKYAWQSKLGDNRNEVFQIIKSRIIRVIDCVLANNLKEIDTIDLGNVIRWKVAALYQNRHDLPILPFFYVPGMRFVLDIKNPGPKMAELQQQARLLRGDKAYWEYYEECLKKFLLYRDSRDDSDEAEDVEEIEEANDELVPGNRKNRVWLFAPGRGGEHWDRFYQSGIMAIGWNYLGDLKKYDSKEQIAQAMRAHENSENSSKKNNANSCFSFGTVMQPGDMVFAKIGRDRIIGKGVIVSDYSFDESLKDFGHIRKVNWQLKGAWTVSLENNFALKTITEITRYQDFVDYLDELVTNRSMVQEKDPEYQASSQNIQYWWLNANPKIWDYNSLQIGEKQEYTSHNGSNNKRRIYQYFKDVKVGDLVLGYISSPVKQITSICRISKELNTSNGVEVIEFEKIEQLSEPIPLKKLQSIKQLNECEPLVNNQGSLFKLSGDEFEIIRSIIDENNPQSNGSDSHSPRYTLDELMGETGYTKEKTEGWLQSIQRKKQVVFFGPPGTGKTYVAERLARHIVSESDGFYDSIQFHPSYSYEEFIQGIRPETDDSGNLQFEVKSGRFMDFCNKARSRKSKCVLIIDELNRANLSRVFGELMYLLEYRNKEIFLAGGMKFSIPENVIIIATMNTADRSIALVDFALRRRFAFLELAPEYEILRNFQSKNGYDADSLIQVLQEINNKIDDRNFHLGISFFMSNNLKKEIEEIWRMEIETYLEEYFFGQPNAVSAFRFDVLKSKLMATVL